MRFLDLIAAQIASTAKSQAPKGSVCGVECANTSIKYILFLEHDVCLQVTIASACGCDLCRNLADHGPPHCMVLWSPGCPAGARGHKTSAQRFLGDWAPSLHSGQLVLSSGVVLNRSRDFSGCGFPVKVWLLRWDYLGLASAKVFPTRSPRCNLHMWPLCWLVPAGVLLFVSPCHLLLLDPYWSCRCLASHIPWSCRGLLWPPSGSYAIQASRERKKQCLLDQNLSFFPRENVACILACWTV